MRNNKIISKIISFLFFGGLLTAWDGHKEDPHYVWFEGGEVAVQEDGIYADSNKGMFKLSVIEYDRVNNRYKVLCRCLEDSHLDPAEALSVPYKSISR